MATPLDTFLATCEGIHSIGIDYVDEDVEPDEEIIYAFVEFRPRLAKDHVIWSPGLGRGIQLDTIKARFSPEDGKLRTIVAQPQNERQTITVTGDPFTLTFDGETTDPIDEAASQLEVETAIRALSNVGANVYVTGDPGGPFNVFFAGVFAGTDVPEMTATNATVDTFRDGEANAGVRLVANTALIDLDELVYDVTFTVPESDRTLAGFAFTAPTTADQTVALETVTKLPHRSTLGL